MTLDDIMLSDTPQEIVEEYKQYAQRAKTERFGILEQDVVVLDTETTGLNFKECELIEIAAARLRGTEVVDRFHTFVHPSGPIPEEIINLTGITDLDVIHAPSAKEAVAGLVEFVDKTPVVAHNATFDRTFIEKVPGGVDVSDEWFDSLTLSRIALPRLSSHKLADMAQAFGCDSVSHRAMDDVDALCGVWRILLVGLSSLPAGVLGAMADMHEEVAWPLRPIIRQISLSSEGSNFNLKTVRAELLNAQTQKARLDAVDKLGDLSFPTADEIEVAFETGGYVDQMYDSYEQRSEQQIMSEEVRRAFATSTNRSIEAGTGVGKTVAYLLPSILFAKRNDVTVGVATKTNALTDQLISHELPLLDKVIPGGVTYFSLKGYNHYPCLRRVLSAMRQELPNPNNVGKWKSRNTMESDMVSALAIVLAYACQSPSGDIDSLGIRWSSVPRSLLTCSSKECTKTRCPFFTKGCFVHDARRRAATADIVVTNHSLLLRNVEVDGKILPPIRHWIVDEAHSFESEARRQWAVEVSAEKSKAIFEALGGTKTGAIHGLMTAVSNFENSSLGMGLLTRVAAELAQASVCAADFFEDVRGLAAITPENSKYPKFVLWINQQVRETEQWNRLLGSAGLCMERLAQVCKTLREINQYLAESTPDNSLNLNDETRDLEYFLASLHLIADNQDTSYVFMAEVSRKTKFIGQEKLEAQKIDIGEALAERWYPEMLSVVYASATIAVADSFKHFDTAVGLDRLGASSYKDLKLESSFDYENNMRSLVAYDLPDPRSDAYVEKLAEMLYDVHTAMDGSVLTLFTNRREMETTYEILKPRLEKQGLELICQEKNMSTYQVRRKFMSKESNSLFALKSFWEGFDATGDTLRCVVITKLPFSSPTDPLSCERSLRDRRAWWNYSLPEAVIAVKQAAGRLIRCETDKGVLVLCDSRLITKNYGNKFIQSLPTSTTTQLSSEFIGKYINTWRENA